MSLDDRAEEEAHIYQPDNADYDQQLALERQTLLQQIYEYPWLLQDDDIDQVTVFLSPIIEQSLITPSVLHLSCCPFLFPRHHSSVYTMPSLPFLAKINKVEDYKSRVVLMLYEERLGDEPCRSNSNHRTLDLARRPD
jgi:hypothetical protein